jgi:hypothetical protein
LAGTHAEILAAISAGECGLRKWQVGVARPFLVFLHDRKIRVSEVTTDTLAAYYAERLEVSSKTERKCRRHVIEVSNFLRDASEVEALGPYGFRPVKHPFGKHAGKYGVKDELIVDLMAEFDCHVAPWATGLVSRTGQPLAEFIKALDKRETSVSDNKALLRKRRAERAARPRQKPVVDTLSNDALLKANGFLTDKDKWSARTLKTRRGYIVSLAKAIVATLDVVPATMEELLDPEYLEAAIDGIGDANTGEFSSGYRESLLACAMKIAKDFQCRSQKDLDRIDKLLEAFHVGRKGIAPRNRAKLCEFDEARIQRTIDLGDMILADVNNRIDLRRKAHRLKYGTLPARADVIDVELGRDIMTAIAHELLLRNAPRSDNLIHAELSWVSWQDDRARITVPAVRVKMRGPDDE